MEKERIKLDRNIGGIKNMRSMPAAVFVVDPNKEQIAVKEAINLNIPVIALTDTNCNPDGLSYIIPGNDDAIRAIKLVTSTIADAVLDGRSQFEEAEALEEEMVEQALAESTKAVAEETEVESTEAVAEETEAESTDAVAEETEAESTDAVAEETKTESTPAAEA
jgi:small subunit ribosomal protein S2